MNARFPSCVLAVAALAACGRPALPPDPPALAKFSPEEPFNPSPVRSIEVDHEGCFGACPVYRVKLSDDGTWEWEGTEFVRYPGRRAGSVFPDRFSPLFVWLQAHPALYAASADRTRCDHCAVVQFRFALKSGKSIVVKYSLSFDGDDYWALSTIVDAIVERAMSKGIDDSQERRPDA